MTREAIHDFAKALRSDEEMGRGLIAAIGQKQGGEAVEAFVAYAREQGFAVTTEDAETLQTAARSKEDGTLSDDELDGVAGGIFAALSGAVLNSLAAGSQLGSKALGSASKALDDLALKTIFGRN